MDLKDIPVRSDRELFIKNSCMELLDKHGDDQKEHAYQLALFVAKEMEQDYKPVVFSGSKPDVLDEYRSLDETGKMKWDKEYPDWRKRHDIQEYQNTISSVQSTNKSNKEFLQECLEALDKIKNPVEYEKISSMLAEFEVRDQKVAKIDWNN